MKAKLGIAPIAWWNDDLAELSDVQTNLPDVQVTVIRCAFRGVIAIQSGENPRVIKQKLLMYLPPAQRPDENEEA